MSSTPIPTEVTLRAVADWQLAPPETMNFRVQLPKLQRGFVWEPSKVMDLWDSILRGFPIGSMMISSIDPEPTADAGEGKHFWLLDGQQRATSIALGFYNPWKPQGHDPSMWSPKSIPILWVDLLGEQLGNDQKMFFPNLVTQSHPWGYKSDGNVIYVSDRRHASADFKLQSNYTKSNLKSCFPWMTKLPVPLSFLIDAARQSEGAEEAWNMVAADCREFLPEHWHKRYAKYLDEALPVAFGPLIKHLSNLEDYKIHLNHLTREAADNDDYNADDNSLLFVRLNTGGVVLGGEELIFSLFKSAFPLAKDTVEKCAADFMAPSKLFGLLARLAGASEDPSKLSRSVTLREFKKEIRPADAPLRKALDELVREENRDIGCEAARLMACAKLILCGDQTPDTDFCLPEAVATRTINESPDVFLALLYWLRCKKHGPDDQSRLLGTEEHRRLLGCFTLLSWFQPGNARAKQEALRNWVAAAGDDVAGRLWSGDCLHFFFTRKELAIPVFPQSENLASFLSCDAPDNVQQGHHYNYESLSGTAHHEFWNAYSLIPEIEDEADDLHKQRLEGNFNSFLSRLRGCKSMLLYVQRAYLRKRFESFGQWEVTLKETNCPWDWDHIYPSASGLHNVDDVYKNWHNTIGNLRAEGLSENRRDGCNTPTEKLALEDSDGTPGWKNSAIYEDIWEKMQSMEYRHNAIKETSLARSICGIVLKRMVSIYAEWHGQLLIGPLMDEIRSIASEARERETPTEPTTSPEIIPEPSASPV